MFLRKVITNLSEALLEAAQSGATHPSNFVLWKISPALDFPLENYFTTGVGTLNTSMLVINWNRWDVNSCILENQVLQSRAWFPTTVNVFN